MIGYGLQFHAAVEITQPTINRLISKDGQRLAAEMSARLLLFIFAGKVKAFLGDCLSDQGSN